MKPIDCKKILITWMHISRKGEANFQWQRKSITFTKRLMSSLV